MALRVVWNMASSKEHNEQGIFKYEARRKRFHFICISVLLHRKYFCDKKEKGKKETIYRHVSTSTCIFSSYKSILMN